MFTRSASTNMESSSFDSGLLCAYVHVCEHVLVCVCERVLACVRSDIAEWTIPLISLSPLISVCYLTAWLTAVDQSQTAAHTHAHTQIHTQFGVSVEVLPTVRVIMSGPNRLIVNLFLCGPSFKSIQNSSAATSNKSKPAIKFSVSSVFLQNDPVPLAGGGSETVWLYRSWATKLKRWCLMIWEQESKTTLSGSL